MDDEIDGIRRYIIDEAEAKAKALRAEKKAEIKALIREWEEELGKEQERIMEHARIEGTAKKKTIIATAVLDRKKAVLEEKRRLMDEVIHKAMAMVSALSAEKKGTMIKALITGEEVMERLRGVTDALERPSAEESGGYVDIGSEDWAVEFGGVGESGEEYEKDDGRYVVYIIPTEGDDSWLTDAFVDDVNGAYRKAGVSVVFRPNREERCEGAMGCILTLARIEVDLRIEALIASKKKEFEQVIIQHLFG